MSIVINPASFRDPSGFVYSDDSGRLLRQVNSTYQDDYQHLMTSGLYDELVSDQLLIEHQEVDESLAADDDCCTVLEPRRLPFISYPYEWCFSALKAAALLTLEIQQRAVRHGMTLKDASAYNIQFEGYRPVFIDSLSFERLRPGEPWIAYKQFCQHFLAPLALMAKTDVSVGQMLSLHLDGIPLELASKLLPWRTCWQPGLLMHVHMQAKLIRKYSDTSTEQHAAQKAKQRGVSANGLVALLEHLAKTTSRLDWKPRGTEWADYYSSTSYSDSAFEDKKTFVKEFLTQVQPDVVWDLGANTGVFSRLASDLGCSTFALDVDPACVEKNYRQCRHEGRLNLHPLLLDLTNPAPGVGWANAERESLLSRSHADCVMALALIHHLCIANNVPLPSVAKLLASLGKYLVIEFVPKQDPQVKRLLRSRKDVFHGYHQEGFEQAFQQHFRISAAKSVGADGRVLYLLETIA